MNLQVDMATLPRMSGECLSISLRSSDEAFGGRPAPCKQHDATAKPLAALWRSNLAGHSVSRILPGTSSDGTEGLDQDREPTAIFVERMLADPIIHLVMLADGVSEQEIRTLYGMRLPTKIDGRDRPDTSVLSMQERDIPEQGPRPGSPRPGIGE
ncbi:MAG: hypothetical protein GYB53_10835 [Rhodobacteraceae bacterium]|nr:hypothetical protein [Paracoccaceae bacterium]MBR9821686.1 hypothetical protein [Paracoccaceae bacterium]